MALICFPMFPPSFPDGLKRPGELTLEPPMPKLTKRPVDTLRPDGAGKDLFYWDAGDGALKGFGIRLKPSGAGAFIIHIAMPRGGPGGWCSARSGR